MNTPFPLTVGIAPPGTCARAWPGSDEVCDRPPTQHLRFDGQASLFCDRCAADITASSVFSERHFYGDGCDTGECWS